MHVPALLGLCHDRHAEQAPAAALCVACFVGVLALQAHTEVISPTDHTLVHTQSQAAFASQEGRRHDLLCLDHVPEEPKISHLDISDLIRDPDIDELTIIALTRSSMHPLIDVNLQS